MTSLSPTSKRARCITLDAIWLSNKVLKVESNVNLPQSQNLSLNVEQASPILFPAAHQILNSSKSTPKLRGPAGNINYIPPIKSLQKNEELINNTSNYSDLGEFASYGSWTQALQILNLPFDDFHLGASSHPSPTFFESSFLCQHNIQSLLEDSSKPLIIPYMLVLVKSVLWRHHEPLCLVVDPTGKIPACIHPHVMHFPPYGKNLKTGSTLILRKVPIYRSAQTRPYLLVTIQNLVRILNPHTPSLSLTELEKLKYKWATSQPICDFSLLSTPSVSKNDRLKTDAGSLTTDSPNSFSVGSSSLPFQKSVTHNSCFQPHPTPVLDDVGSFASWAEQQFENE